MEKSIITTGKTLDLAIQAALDELRMDRDDVSVEVLENARSGFFGIGASPAKVKVTFEVPDPKPAEPAPALSAASRKPRKQAPRLEKLPEQPKPQPVQPEKPKPEQPGAEQAKPEQPRQQKQTQPKKQSAKKSEQKKQAPKKPVPEKVYEPAPEGSQEARVEVFLKGLFERMDSEAVPHAFRKDDDTIAVELTGDGLGALIGRRGETLDAIQHLANYSLNRDANKRTRVSVDAENYRGKREEALRHLARKMSVKVIKYHKNMTLEPMNAYERHVIHATLQEVPEVTTFSTGTEPNRRVVISYVKE